MTQPNPVKAAPGPRRVDSSEVQVGDDLIYLGQYKRITEIRAYEGTLFAAADAARVAYSHDGWSVTLLPGHGWWVA